MEDKIYELKKMLDDNYELAINDDNKHFVNEINKLKKTIEDRRYFMKKDFDFLVELIQKYNKEADTILYNVMFQTLCYNQYLTNKKIKVLEPDLGKDIIDMHENYLLNNISKRGNNEIIKYILDYLEVDEKELDPKLAEDLKKYANKEKIMEFARIIKTSEGMERILYDKISDKNILISILLHSDIDKVRAVINKFKENNTNISKIIEGIPSIFLITKINDKCKYNVMCNYDKFMGNCELIKKFNLNFKSILMKNPLFFINNIISNEQKTNKLKENNVNPNIIFCETMVGNIFLLNEKIVFSNINLLKFHNIPLTDDQNNKGYSILGMYDLDDKIDYLIEKKLWKNDNSKLDNIDLIRALVIKDNYLKWQKNEKCDILKNVLFEEKEINEDLEASVYAKYPILKNVDEAYLIDGNYVINDNMISRHRILVNLNNYKGDVTNALKESFIYKSNLDLEIMNEVVNSLPSIEMGEKRVNLS